MSENVKRAELPSSELGEDRCFEIGYFGHGDIVVSTWQGELEHDPRYNDGISTRFGFTHCSDAVILASLAGFLTKTGRKKESISQIMLEAGSGVLVEDDKDRFERLDLRAGYLSSVANGESACRYDVEDLGLECLVVPITSHPGLIDRTGGTVIYTGLDEERKSLLLIFGRCTVERSENGERGLSLGDTAGFTEEDVPIIARLVCDLALGEYKRDVQAFLIREFTDEDEQ